MKNKLVFITRESADLPGARIRSYDFAESMKNRGLNTDVLSFADHLGAYSGQDEGKLNVFDKIRYNLKAIKRLLRYENAVFVIQRVNYHSIAPFFMYLIKRKKVSMILDMDDWEIKENLRFYTPNFSNSNAERLTSLIAKNSEFCIASSKFLQAFLKKYNTDVLLIPSTTALISATDSYEDRREQHKVIFSWVGTINRKDDAENIIFAIDSFMEAVEKTPDISLEIVGDGLYYNMIEYYINSNRIVNYVKLLKSLSHDRVMAYLKTIDVGLLPLTQQTKFNKAKSPAKLFEYMAAGKAIIASPIGEVQEILTNRVNALLAEDKEAFTEAICRLANRQDLREKLGGAAYENIKTNCSKEYFMDQLYERIIKIT